jgi:CheY-like chemotaxis protein
VLDGVAHAAEGPLAALALDLDAIRSGTVPLESVEELESALDDCSIAVEGVARVLRDAQVLARASHDDPREFVAVAPLIDRVLRALGGSSALLAHIEVHCEPDVPKVHVPRRLLGRTIAQVLVQALDAVPAEPPPDLRRLRVAVRSAPEAVAIIIDAHPSLESAPASTPFTVTTEGRLAVARAAMRSLDGELVAERAVDGSVRFVAFIPSVATDADAPRVETARRPSENAAPRARVLVVDGDAMVLRATSRALAESYDVVVAISGGEALSVVRDGGIDAIVLDTHLSDMSVDAFLDELRRLQSRLSSRVLFVCRTPEEASALGGCALERPIRRAQMLAIIEQLLTASAAAPTPSTSVISRPRILN